MGQLFSVVINRDFVDIPSTGDLHRQTIAGSTCTCYFKISDAAKINTVRYPDRATTNRIHITDLNAMHSDLRCTHCGPTGELSQWTCLKGMFT